MRISREPSVILEILAADRQQLRLFVFFPTSLQFLLSVFLFLVLGGIRPPNQPGPLSFQPFRYEAEVPMQMQLLASRSSGNPPAMFVGYALSSPPWPTLDRLERISQIRLAGQTVCLLRKICTPLGLSWFLAPSICSLSFSQAPTSPARIPLAKVSLPIRFCSVVTIFHCCWIIIIVPGDSCENGQIYNRSSGHSWGCLGPRGATARACGLLVLVGAACSSSSVPGCNQVSVGGESSEAHSLTIAKLSCARIHELRGKPNTSSSEGLY